MRTHKTTFGTRTKLTTPVADLGGIVRFNSNNFNSSSFSFVLDEILQLKETPIVNPIIHNSPSILFPDTFEVLHYNLVSFESRNNTLTNVMINPSHITSFTPTNLPKKTISRPCAFSLKFTSQIFKLPFNLLDFSRVVEPAVRTDSEVIYSEVNTQNNVLRTNVLLSGINLFRESEQEETSTFFIHPKQTLLDIPIEIFFVTIWDSELELLPTLEQPQNENISFEISTSWEIVSDRSSFNDGFGFSLLYHTTSLFKTSDSNLGWQFELLSDRIINFVMEFDIIPNFMFPRIINTELECFSICFDSSNYLFGWINSHFCSHISSHINSFDIGVYKGYGQMSSGQLEIASPPTAKAMGIRSRGVL